MLVASATKRLLLFPAAIPGALHGDEQLQLADILANMPDSTTVSHQRHQRCNAANRTVLQAAGLLAVMSTTARLSDWP